MNTNSQESISKGSPNFDAKSAFKKHGFNWAIEYLESEIQELYCSDNVPWIIGYSGGKDSTAVLQLVWNAINKLPVENRQKIIYVITTDTMVENPVVSMWVTRSVQSMKKSAQEQELPFTPRQLYPDLQNRFWVNLIGKGYPAPRHKFRWCTHRLKILPSNNFINSVVSSSGEAILVLGTRKAESSSRAASMSKHEQGRVRDRLSPNAGLPGSLVYTPIEDWTNDDVWFYLMQAKNPWSHSNRDLLGMYAGATEDGECPLVIDESTPSCGSSRFGCWVCTLVEQDKSMSAMIQNDEEKEWMLPLLQIRNYLDFRTNEKGEYSENADRSIRDFRRMGGQIQIMSSGKEIPGPYLQSTRTHILRLLLKAQTYIHKNGPEHSQHIELISMEELEEIRRIWVVDKHEIEDVLPDIYQQVTGQEYPGNAFNDHSVLGSDAMQELAKICGDDRLHYELVRELLSITQKRWASARRAGLYQQLEQSFQRHFYDNREDAISRAGDLSKMKNELKISKKEALMNEVFMENAPGMESSK